MKTVRRCWLVLGIALLSPLVACSNPGGGGPQTPGNPQPPPTDNGSATPVRNTIAYVEADTSDEIRLVAPDGTNNRRLWAHGLADPHEVYAVWSLTWRPDARALAFASTHENWCSLNQADIFSLGADGSGYRRVTESPACAELANYPKGTVQVPVENVSGASFVGFVYFQGAPSVQQVSLPPGGSSVVTFANVADMGNQTLQIAALINPPYRNIDLATAVDVQAGGTVTSGVMAVYNPDTFWEAFSPTWRSDGSRLGYVFGLTGPKHLPPNPQPLEFGSSLLAEDAALPNIIVHLAWGPTAQTANQLLYQGNRPFESEAIYLATEGGSSSEPLMTYPATEFVLGLAWLPNGSGFVYSVTEGDDLSSPRSANLFRYDLATRQTSRLTSFSGEFTGLLSVSPDAQQVVFERAAELGPNLSLTNPDLWLVDLTGGGPRLLVENGRAPAWSP